ncbi:MAG: response regulator transcription factor [Acidobacteria bacterium]|nr:response regulator transcription factor [Acidobacteriota bacterium]
MRLDPTLRSHVLLFGLLGGALIAGLRFIEYRWLVVEHSIEIYGGLVAALFAGVGLWLGRRLVHERSTVVIRDVVREVPVPALPAFVRDQARVQALGITPRELEILELIAEGLSTREIADRAHVSENTVKTHSGRVFDKLGARRRTQAVQRGRELRLIP